MVVETVKIGCTVFSKLHYVVDSGATCKVAMLGSTPELGEWDATRAVIGQQSKRDEAYWCFNVHMDDGAEFKYVLLNTATTSVERWEERGTNRRFQLPGGAPNHPVLVESVWGHGARCLDQDPDLCSVYGEVIMASQKEISITADKPKTTVASGQLLYDHHYIPWVMAYTTPRNNEVPIRVETAAPNGSHTAAKKPSLIGRFFGNIPLLTLIFKDP